ncbi:MAG TPA: DNA-binding domain-containing protein [Casimicrobiaceae bacterium]|nr:DNA-binding domain-containing protein [Casimicrobiaceae bacterium]
MSETAALQAALAAALTARDVGTADVAVLQGPAARVRQRLAFYRGNVQANAHKALRNAFPVCERVVGEAFFEGMSHRFAAAVPSCSGDLNAYGAPFPAFVRGFAPAASLPYLPDVAALEWCVHRAHYAANRPPADLRVLAGVSAERYADLRVVLHPAVALLTTQSAAVRIWQAHQPGQGEVSDVDPAAGPDRALVYRPHFRVEVAALDHAPYAFLEACAAGASLDEATRAASALDGAFALETPLVGWVRDRVIAEIRLP